MLKNLKEFHNYYPSKLKIHKVSITYFEQKEYLPTDIASLVETLNPINSINSYLNEKNCQLALTLSLN